jgi:3-dehydroquinate dehydratase
VAVAKEQEQSNQEDSLVSVTHQTQDQWLAIIAKPKVVSLALNAQNLDHFLGIL